MYLKMLKQGETSVGTILLLISILLIVLTFVGLYIHATNKLETKGFKTAEKTKSMISTKIIPSELQSTYENGKIQQFNVNAKLSPGSEDIYFANNLVITLTTDDEKTTLTYAGVGSDTNHSATGYYTLGIETYSVPSTLLDDIDQDGKVDYLSIGNNNSAVLNLSTGEDIYLGNCSDATTFNSYSASSSYLTSYTGTCSGSSVVNVTLTPKGLGMGKYSIEYLITDERHQDGRLMRGEMVKIFFESQNLISNDKTGSLDFIIKSGTESTLSFYVPDVDNVGTAFLSHY